MLELLGYVVIVHLEYRYQIATKVNTGLRLKKPPSLAARPDQTCPVSSGLLTECHRNRTP